MNRDEHLSRSEAGLISTYSDTNIKHKIAFPQDQRSGGTWIGVNEFGIVLCLLNRYQDSIRHSSKSAIDNSEKLSRGTIIPKALKYKSVKTILDYLQSLNLFQFEAFDLLIISLQATYQFSWNGKAVVLHDVSEQHKFMITSSSINIEQVTHYRRQQFECWLEHRSEVGSAENLASSVLGKFHLSQQSENKSYSVLMSRLDTPHQTHTKSITQIAIDQTKHSYSELNINYFNQNKIQQWLNESSFENITPQQEFFRLSN
jgi:hypothetical protein